jgi:hypothetical protein
MIKSKRKRYLQTFKKKETLLVYLETCYRYFSPFGALTLAPPRYHSRGSKRARERTQNRLCEEREVTGKEDKNEAISIRCVN